MNLSIFQNAKECFCGDGKNLHQYGYEKKHNVDCNANCANNEQEKCGRHGLISIYTTNTGKVYINVTKMNIQYRVLISVLSLTIQLSREG